MKSYIGKEINGEIWIRASDVIDDKPQVRLSVEQLQEIYDKTSNRGIHVNTFGAALDALQEAILAAQREPESIPFDFEKWHESKEWQLLFDGSPTDSITLHASIGRYTMRKKS